jgi:hypothetical protein
MTAFIDFMAGPAGRLIRFVAGVVLVIIAYFVGGAWLYVLGIVGLVVLAAGLFDFCIFAPLAGLPLSGKAIRGREH